MVMGDSKEMYIEATIDHLFLGTFFNHGIEDAGP
jgi:hypothetical protein